MQRIYYIALFSLIFLLIGLLLQFQLIETMPMVLLGGCLGWALAEFRQEVRKKS